MQYSLRISQFLGVYFSFVVRKARDAAASSRMKAEQRSNEFFSLSSSSRPLPLVLSFDLGLRLYFLLYEPQSINTAKNT